MSKEETFLFPLKYIDVTRSTHIDLDVFQEKKIDDYWNVVSSEHLNEKPPKGYMWSGERLTKIQSTTRPDCVWPEVWTKIGKAAQNRGKQELAQEKPKLDNVPKLRVIFFIDPDDRQYSEILKNARRKLERLMAPSHAMQNDGQGASKNRESGAKQWRKEKKFKTMYGCVVESHESTRQRSRLFAVQNSCRSRCRKGSYF